MQQTKLVVARCSLTGFFDTGSTHLNLSVDTMTYDPDAVASKRIREKESQMAAAAEVFMDDTTSEWLTSRVMKMLARYEEAMFLP